MPNLSKLGYTDMELFSRLRWEGWVVDSSGATGECRYVGSSLISVSGGGDMMDEDWLSAALSSAVVHPDDGGAVDRLHALLEGWADGFAKKRTDVVSSRLALPRRGVAAR